MKKTKILILSITFILIIFCFIYIWHRNSQAYDTMINQYENKIREYELSEEKLCDQLEELKKENSSIREESELQTQELQELQDFIANFHMSPPETGFYEAISEKKYMTIENVTLRKMPSDNEYFYTGNILSYKMVKPLAVIFETITDLQDRDWKTEDRHWVLVSCRTFGELVDSYGWVKFSELIEYNEATMHLLQGPFMLASDAVDVETGELVHSLLRGSQVSVEFMNDCVRVSTDGGICAYVDKKYIVYPEP